MGYDLHSYYNLRSNGTLDIVLARFSLVHSSQLGMRTEEHQNLFSDGEVTWCLGLIKKPCLSEPDGLCGAQGVEGALEGPQNSQGSSKDALGSSDDAPGMLNREQTVYISISINVTDTRNLYGSSYVLWPIHKHKHKWKGHAKFIWFILWPTSTIGIWIAHPHITIGILRENDKEQ